MITVQELQKKYDGIVASGATNPKVANFGRFLQQVNWEWTSVIKELSNFKIDNALEIGSYGGGSLCSIANLASDNAKIMSIDICESLYVSVEMKQSVLRGFAERGQEIHTLDADSHLPESLEETKRFFGESPLDLLFIDGDHHYEGVKKDFEMYAPLVKSGGIVMFHDIQPHVRGSQVEQLWKELNPNYTTKEFIEDPEKQTWAGIGILWMP